MAGRLNWGTIALLATAFALTGAVSIVSTLRNARRDVAVATDPDAVPLDYADQYLRSALDSYGQFTLGRGLDPIAPTCTRDSSETYRLVILPGEGVIENGFTATDVAVSGGQALVVRRQFDRLRGHPEEAAWQVTYRRKLAQTESASLRERASQLLLSGKRAAPGDHPIDASEWYVEMCRRGRYHFAGRYGPQNSIADDVEFLAFAREMLALHRSEGGGP